MQQDKQFGQLLTPQTHSNSVPFEPSNVEDCMGLRPLVGKHQTSQRAPAKAQDFPSINKPLNQVGKRPSLAKLYEIHNRERQNTSREQQAMDIKQRIKNLRQQVKDGVESKLAVGVMTPAQIADEQKRKKDQMARMQQ